MVDTIWQDCRYAVRSLRRTPGFAVAAIVTLALGIGANSAIFTLLDAVMLKPLNVPAPQDLVALYEQPREGTPDATGGTGRYTRFSYPRFERPVIRLPVGRRVAIVAVAAAAALGAFVGSSLQKPSPAPAPSGGPQLSFRTDQNLLRQLPHQPKQPASPEPAHVPGQPPEGFV